MWTNAGPVLLWGPRRVPEPAWLLPSASVTRSSGAGTASLWVRGSWGRVEPAGGEEAGQALILSIDLSACNPLGVWNLDLGIEDHFHVSQKESLLTQILSGRALKIHA